MSYRIGSFNLHKLSYATKDSELEGDDKHTRRDYFTIGEIIRSSANHYDVVALQEVLNENVLKLIFPAGCGWDKRWTPSRSNTDPSSEGYAFAWNTRRLSLVCEPSLWEQYKYDDVLGKYGLIRHPYYGRFTPSGSIAGGPYVEFRLINTHIRFKPKINEVLDAGAVELRKREFKVLAEQILEKLTYRRYEKPGNNCQKVTVLLGDYNLNLKSSGAKSPYVDSVIMVADGPQIKKIVTTQNELSTLSRRKEIDSVTGEIKWMFEGLANNYDHFTYDETYIEEQGISLSPGVIDAVSIYKNNDYEQYWREISDHLPITLDIDFK